MAVWTPYQLRGPGDTSASFKARATVLAAGGLESTRLLLAARRSDPERFGGENGPLGRYYMGHLYGIAAEMVLDNPAVDAGINYFAGPDGYYIRRRFTPSAELVRRAGLSNTSFMAGLSTDPRSRASQRHHVAGVSGAFDATPWPGDRR